MAENSSSSLLRWLSRPESLVGLSAVLISIVAVTVSAYEARVMREWQRAAVWPYVQLSRSLFYNVNEAEDSQGREWTLTLNAENVGVGPAQVRDFRVTIDGVAYPDWGAAMNALLDQNEDIEYGHSTINGTIIPAGRNIQMFQLRNSTMARLIYDRMGRLDFEACFCSVFGECWRTSYSNFGAVIEEKNCKPSAGSFSD